MPPVSGVAAVLPCNPLGAMTQPRIAACVHDAARPAVASDERPTAVKMGGRTVVPVLVDLDLR